MRVLQEAPLWTASLEVSWRFNDFCWFSSLSLIVRYLPDWLPGLRSLKYAHDNKFAIVNMHEIPYNGALKEMEEGVIRDSFIHNLLSKHKENEKQNLPNEFTLADIKGIL